MAEITGKLSYTPGPYSVRSPGYTVMNKKGSCVEVVGPNNNPICHVYERRNGKLMPSIPNARLLAAAPEMLAILKAILAKFDPDIFDLIGNAGLVHVPLSRQEIDAIRAALAQADKQESPEKEPYPPCAICNGPNNQGEICEKCARDYFALPDLEQSGGWMAQDYRASQAEGGER